MVKPWIFVNFNIIISHIFPETFIEIPQVVQKISRFSTSILTNHFHQNFGDMKGAGARVKVIFLRKRKTFKEPCLNRVKTRAAARKFFFWNGMLTQLYMELKYINI